MATQKAQRADIDTGAPVNTGASTAKAAKSAGKAVGKATSAKVVDLATRRAQADIKANGAKPVAAPAPAPVAPAEPASTGNSIRDQYRETFGRDPARGRSFAQMKLDIDFHESHAQYQEAFGKSAGNMPISKVRAAVEQHQNRLDYQKAFGQSADKYVAPSRIGAAVEAHKEYVDVFGENPKNQRSWNPFGSSKPAPPTAEQMHAQIARSNSMSGGWGGKGGNSNGPASRAYMAGNGLLALGVLGSGFARANAAKQEGASGLQQAGQFALGAGEASLLPAGVAGGLYAMSRHTTLGKYAPSIGKGLLPAAMALTAISYAANAWQKGGSAKDIALAAGRGAWNGVVPWDHIIKPGIQAAHDWFAKPSKPAPINPGDQPMAGRERKMTSGEQQTFAEANRHFEDSHMQGQSAKSGDQQPDQQKTGLKGFQHARTQAFAQAGKAAKRGGTYNGPDPSSIDVAERAQRAGA